MRLRLVDAARPVVSPEVTRFVALQHAEGKSNRTVLERRATLRRLESALGCSAIEAEVEAVTEWLGRPGRSVTTIASDLSKLRAFYRWATLAGLRADDPTRWVKAPRRPRRQPRPITDPQFWRLVNTAGTNELRAMLLLAGLAGLRVCEVARFQGHHLDAEAQTLTVTGKGGHRATIPAHPEILAIAKRMPRGFWFPSQRDDHLGGRTVSQRLRLHMIRNKVQGTAHALRHYFCTQLVARGADLRVVQELARHSQLSTTAIYVGVADERKRAAIDTLGRPPE